MKRMNKKGSVADLIFIGVVLLVFAVAVLIGFKITGMFNTQIQGMDIMPAEAKTASTSILGFYPGVIDNSFLLLAAGLAIVSLILASLVRVHPIFLALFVIAWIFSIFLGGVFSNIYQEMTANSALAAEAAQLTFTNFVMTYLPFFIGIVGILLMIVMYKLSDSGA